MTNDNGQITNSVFIMVQLSHLLPYLKDVKLEIEVI